jgi:hypothetical protein
VTVARPAKSKAAASSAPPSTPNRERPPEPKRFKASKEQLLDFYKQMLLIRRFEERAGQLYGLGLIGGFCHLYIGQEAVAVGLQSAMTVGRTASSPAIATMAICSPTGSTQGDHGRADRPRRRNFKGQGRFNAHV